VLVGSRRKDVSSFAKVAHTHVAHVDALCEQLRCLSFGCGWQLRKPAASSDDPPPRYIMTIGDCCHRIADVARDVFVA